MKIFLLLLMSTLFLFAKPQDSCYSVQLTSFVLKENSSYDFELQDYPRYCALMQIGEMSTVRCACYEEYIDAKKEQENLKYFYPDAMLVKSYKKRFENIPYKNDSYKKSKLKTPKVLMPKTQTRKVQTPKVQTPKRQKAQAPIVKKQDVNEELEVLQETAASSYLQNLSVSGELALDMQYYMQAPKEKNLENITLDSLFEIEYKAENLTLASKLKAQADYSDVVSQNENRRTYLRLDELYAQYDFLDDQILVGKSIRFWGALELRNISDGFNPTELRDDPFNMDKLGVWNASYSHYFDLAELSLIVKFYEQSREMAGYPYVYYYFPETINGLANNYEESLISEKAKTRPSIYLKYGGTLEGDYPLDYAFILQNGYDSQRYYSSRFVNQSVGTKMQENAYLVNKITTYNTMVVGATLLKLEALYTDVIDNEEISDYMHIGFGAEYTLGGVYKNADLALMAEYYKYIRFDKSKRSDLELFELFQNDLFLGVRYTFNDNRDTTLTGGAVVDMEYDEQVYYLEYESRINDIFRLNFDYRFISPSASELTAFKLMGRHERIGLKFGYAF